MITNTVTKQPAVMVISHHVFAEVCENNNHKSLQAAIACQPGDIICSFSAGETLNHATYLTVQTGINKHITLQPSFLQYCNHSCNPNIFFDTASMQIICIRPILPGDELVFFYPSTEWDMAQPFKCYCGATNCLQFIKGATYLPTTVLQQYRLTHFIQQQLKNKL